MNKLLIILLALAAPPLLAQSESEPAEPEEQAPPEVTRDDTPEPARDPFDYESSEQISEDLSVSFPVDI